MDKYLEELIEKMSRKEDVLSSEESVRYLAYCEAADLSNSDFLPQLITFVENNSHSNRKRAAAYYIIGKILISNPISEFINFLLERLNVETDDTIIASILDRLADIRFPEEINVDPIIQCTESEILQIRQSANRTMRAYNSKYAYRTELDSHQS
jgi:hypothetical protein